MPPTLREQRVPAEGHPQRAASATRLPTPHSTQLSSLPALRKPGAGSEQQDEGRRPSRQIPVPPGGARQASLAYNRQPPTTIPRSAPSRVPAGLIPERNPARTLPQTSSNSVTSPIDRSRRLEPLKTLRRKRSVIGMYMTSQQSKQVSKNEPDSVSAVDTLIIPDPPVHDQPRRQESESVGNLSTASPDIPYALPHTPLSDPVPSLQHSDSPGAISSIATPTTQDAYSPLIATSPPFFGLNRGPSPTVTRSRLEDKPLPVPNARFITAPSKRAHEHPFFRQSSVSKKTQPQVSDSDTTVGSTPPTLATSKSRSKLSKLKPREKAAKTPASQITPAANVHPPELAHLRDARPVTEPQDIAPSRPSRDGAPSLSSDQAASPVIYSNLLTSPQRRKASSEESRPRDLALSPSSRLSSRERTAAGPPLQIPSDSRETTPIIPTKSPSRFGFFKRNKAGPPSDDESKNVKKGPLAGTGHEGYKKHTARKRSQSLNSNGSSNASISPSLPGPRRAAQRNSKDSASTDPAVDDFLSSRLQPIYMRGDGIVSDSQLNTNTHLSPIDDREPTTAQHRAKLSSESGRSSEPPGLSHSRGSSGSEAFLGNTRQVEPLMHEPPPPRRPQPKVAGSPLSQTQSVEWESDGSVQSSTLGESKKSTQRGGWLKWSRNKSPRTVSNDTSSRPPSSSNATDNGSSTPALLQSRPNRAVAHYAPQDSSQPATSLQEIQDYMREVQYEEDMTVRLAEPISLTSSTLISDTSSYYNDSLAGQDQAHSSTTTSSLNLQTITSLPAVKSSPNPSTESSTLADHGEEAMGSMRTDGRPYRLPRIGRIPPVISTRDPLRRHDQSFSRPFGVSQPRPQLTSVMSDTATGAEALGNTGLDYSPVMTQQRPEFLDKSKATCAGSDEAKPSASSQSDTKFLQFETRKNSDASYSSSSMASYFPSAVPAARIPRPGSPLSEDEVWNEYDELLDGIFSSDSWEQASGKRLEMLNNAEAQSLSGNQVATESGTVRRPTLRSIIRAGLKSTSSSSLRDRRISESNPPSDRQSQASSKGRRVTFDDAELASVRSSGSSQVRDSKVLKHNPSTSDLSGEYHIRQPVKRIADVQGTADLRFGSLMTSKFLSFGRAFFSPVGEEIQSGKGDYRVLIIDGLGKDWSYYISLTYSNTMVYNLGPGVSASNKRATLSNWQHLENHRHFNFNDFSSTFPFPEGFFSVVVLRFPPIMNDEILKNVVTECRRVLAPEGFLEMVGLDLDLNNMGSITRKAVRNLKIQLKQHDPDLSLAPLSDSLLLLLGQAGFRDLKRCTVGVPAAGVVGSRENSPGSVDKNNVTRFITDLSENGDRKLANMVSTCGRWWHQSMYEIHLLPEKNLLESFWNDAAILRECERQSTMFKMLICHAQKEALPEPRPNSS